ncbi:MAG: hypothetical protein ACRCX2_37125 [Paraclostridium sp.]
MNTDTILIIVGIVVIVGMMRDVYAWWSKTNVIIRELRRNNDILREQTEILKGIAGEKYVKMIEGDI